METLRIDTALILASNGGKTFFVFFDKKKYMCVYTRTNTTLGINRLLKEKCIKPES
jgi:hypothetical protein